MWALERRAAGIPKPPLQIHDRVLAPMCNRPRWAPPSIAPAAAEEDNDAVKVVENQTSDEVASS
jgi:hypothetical protein